MLASCLQGGLGLLQDVLTAGRWETAGMTRLGATAPQVLCTFGSPYSSGRRPAEDLSLS